MGFRVASKKLFVLFWAVVAYDADVCPDAEVCLHPSDKKASSLLAMRKVTGRNDLDSAVGDPAKAAATNATHVDEPKMKLLEAGHPAAQGKDCDIKYGMDIVAGTFIHTCYSGVTVASDEECKSKCESCAACNAWVTNSPMKRATNACWMTAGGVQWAAAVGSRNGGVPCRAPAPVFRDIGPGCPTITTWPPLFNGGAGDLAACKAECLKHPACAYVAHGWAGGASKWCMAFEATGVDVASPLKTGPNDCGSSGNDGVHTYRLEASK